jgi:hypothetical protein
MRAQSAVTQAGRSRHGTGALQSAAMTIADLHVSISALELAVNATGRILEHRQAHTPEDVDKATKKAVAYRAPGG